MDGWIDTCIHAYTHIHTYVHMHMHACMHAYIQYTNIYIQYVQTYKHTHTLYETSASLLPPLQLVEASSSSSNTNSATTALTSIFSTPNHSLQGSGTGVRARACFLRNPELAHQII